MNILLLLVPLSLVLLVVMISVFVWAVRSGQFDDLDTPPLDMLADRQPELPPVDESRREEPARQGPP